MATAESLKVYFVKALTSSWPLVAAAALFYLLTNGPMLGFGFLDVGTWPSAFDINSCSLGERAKCEAAFSFDRSIRILSICAASLPVANYFLHGRSILQVSRRLTKQGAAWKDRFVNTTLYLMFVVIICNIIWLSYIGYAKFDPASPIEEVLAIVMYGFLTITDTTLVIIHMIDKTDEAKAELGYFFGSLFFIDLPTVVGIIAIWRIGFSIPASFGGDRFPILEALSGGSLVMHIALAQIVLVCLHFQKEIRKQNHVVPANAH